MEIPVKVREELDKMYEAEDSQAYIVGLKGQYLPKKGSIFTIRHYHHIDRNRSNNEIWNLVPLSYDDHIIKLEKKNSKETKKQIYEFMVNRFPEHEEHYKKCLLEVVDAKNRII